MPKIDKELNTHYPLFDEGLYTEVVHQNGERAIKILTGQYKDVIYQYGKINLIPREVSEEPSIDFERAVRSWRSKVRVLRSHLERRIGKEVSKDHPIMEWIYTWAAQVITTRSKVY